MGIRMSKQSFPGSDEDALTFFTGSTEQTVMILMAMLVLLPQ